MRGRVGVEGVWEGSTRKRAEEGGGLVEGRGKVGDEGGVDKKGWGGKREYYLFKKLN